MSAIRPDLPMPVQRAFLPPRQAVTAQTAVIIATAIANGIEPPATPPSPLKGRVRKRARSEEENRAAGAGEAIALPRTSPNPRTPKRSRSAATFASPVRGSPLGSLQVDGAVVSASRSSSGARPANLSAETALSPMKYHDPESLAGGGHRRTLERRRVPVHTILTESPESRRHQSGGAEMRAIRAALQKKPSFRNASVFCVERKGSDGKMRRNYFIVHSNYSASGGHRFFPVAGTDCLIVPGNKISLWHNQYQDLKRERPFRVPTFEAFIRIKLAHEPFLSK